MEAAAKQPGMNPNNDGNKNEDGSGNEESSEFPLGVQFDEDDTSMGTVNDCNDGPLCLKKVIKNTNDFFDQSLDEIKTLELLRQTGKCQHKNYIIETRR